MGTTGVEQRTHFRLDPRLVGRPRKLAAGAAEVELTTVPEMASDDRGLVHGSFTFGLADMAAMLAVNEPHVVLGSAEAKFLKPVVVGDHLLAVASVRHAEGKKRMVDVEVRRGDEVVSTAVCTCFVLPRHVLG